MPAITDLMGYLAEHMPSLNQFIFSIAYITGLALCVMALVNQAGTGRRGDNTPIWSNTVTFLVGVLLLNIQTWTGIIGASFLGGGVTTSVVDQAMVATKVTSVTDTYERAIGLATVLIIPVGWVFILWALLQWNSGPRSNQPGWVWGGMVRMAAGAVCVNFPLVADIMGTSLGLTAGSYTFFSDLISQ